jgi:four helix bundle protein
MHNFRELKIWKKAMDVATNVYKVSMNFPSEEGFGLTSQIRRSAVSVPSNIAEGAGRNTNNEFRHFLGVANGSSYELQTQLTIAKNLALVNDEVDAIISDIDELQKMNFALQKKLT